MSDVMEAESKLAGYSGSPEETVGLVEDGQVDVEDYGPDELTGIVLDLLRAGRADLALPYFEVLYLNVDDLTTGCLREYQVLSTVPELAPMPSQFTSDEHYYRADGAFRLAKRIREAWQRA